jgi:type II secretory ATPase GspE/PulE/Tfp pilus assembly ATPase PilB-like protein
MPAATLAAPPSAPGSAGPPDFERLFDTYGLTPLPLGPRRTPHDLLRAYFNWCDFLGAWPDLAEEPWLPVGAVGPLLLLGHYRPPPRRQPALLPPWMSGRALVSEEAYRAIAAELGASRARNLRHPYEAPASRPSAEAPPSLPDDRAALQFMLEHFILEPAARAAARAALERGAPASELPFGLRETTLFLRQPRAVVDVRFLEVPPELQGLSPRTTRDYHGFCFQRTPQAFFVAFHEVPPHPACDEFTAMFRAEIEDEDRRPIHFALTELDQLRQARQQSRASEVRIKAPEPAAAYVHAVELKLTAEAVRRIDPDRLGTTDEQLAHWALGQAVMANAQDLHVMFERGAGVFRLSKDGVLQTLYTFNEQRWGTVTGVFRDLAKISGPFFQTVSSRFSILYDGSPVDFRVESTPFRDFERAPNLTLRLRRMDGRIRTLGDLRIEESDLKQMRRLISRPDGMFLFTGPTSHGKSTTIYAALTELNQPEVKIMTAEDPIEQVIEGAHQAQVDPLKGLTFASLLRSFLRSAPNIILVGEIRDPETAEMAVGAAHTGHLVFSTLHVRSAAAVPTRLADLKIPAGMIADTLIAAQSQRLIRVLCPVCKAAAAVGPAEAKLFADAGLEPPPTVYAPGSDRRCARCQGRGYSGLTAVMELLEPDDEGFELIRREAGMRAIQAAAEAKGFRPLRVQALRRVAEGLTSLEEAKRKVLFTL